MRTRSRVAAYPMTTAGFTSRASQVTQSSLAQEILEAAKPHPRCVGWLSQVSDERKKVILEVRDGWRVSKSATGISANQLARTLVEKMPDVTFPSLRELARWLNRLQ